MRKKNDTEFAFLDCMLTLATDAITADDQAAEIPEWLQSTTAPNQVDQDPQAMAKEEIKEEEVGINGENEIKKETKEEKEIKKEVGWRDHGAEHPWSNEIVQQERENDELSRIRASSWTSSDQGIGMDYSGTGTPRTLSGSTSPTTFLIPAFEEEQLSKASSKLRNFSKSATS